MTDFDDDKSNGSFGYRVFFSSVLFCVSLGFALYTANQSYRLSARGQKVMATCTKLDYQRVGTDDLATPIWYVAFPTSFGVVREAKVDASFTGLRPGGTIEVLFDPLNPTVVQPNRWFSLWGWPFATTFLSLCFVAELLRLVFGKK